MTQILDKPVETQEATQIIASEPTPGPWGFHDMDRGGELNVVNQGKENEFTSYQRYIGSGKVLIGQVYSHINSGPARGFPSPSFEETAANVNLILASPDLLEAAEEALEVLKMFHGIPRLEEEEQAIVLLEAAIAKARGQVE